MYKGVMEMPQRDLWTRIQRLVCALYWRGNNLFIKLVVQNMEFRSIRRSNIPHNACGAMLAFLDFGMDDPSGGFGLCAPQLVTRAVQSSK